ncbi:MAG: hypothetical protein M1830_001597 [Pleopsidium flavum]|nr:MAG: hypothetical protein M1830_001597 [Pleopsidium flavum]
MSPNNNPQPQTPKLTQHLTNLDPHSFQAATQTPFLHAAGTGTLPKRTLSQWLSQDRLYAQSYIRFIGLLLAKIRLPETSDQTSLPWRITHFLFSALDNIRRELTFFEDTARKYDIDLFTPWEGQTTFFANPVTRGYLDLFMNAAGQGSSLLEGLVVLWATEECYFSSWTYALRADNHPPDMSVENPYTNDLDGGALRAKFIPNWTNESFKGFVTQIGRLVDEVAESDDVMGSQEEKKRCEEVWRQVVGLEERFWPVVAERGQGRGPRCRGLLRRHGRSVAKTLEERNVLANERNAAAQEGLLDVALYQAHLPPRTVEEESSDSDDSEADGLGGDAGAAAP